jgi:methionyl-tRNA formyltransferase
MLRLIMMGTGPFAVPTFGRLLDGPHRVELLVTRPPRELHGKQQADVNPMREVARNRGLAIFEPESINTDEARAELARHQPDLFVVCDYGQILKPETLAIAPLGGINLHASLLPKYRGAAPINWAVYHGELETGDTVIHMTPTVDAGPAIAQVRLAIGPDDTAADLEPRLAELGAPLVARAIEDLIRGTAQAIPQDASQATRAPRLKKTDGQVDWTRSAEAIRNQVRALVPWPKTHTFWQRPAGETQRPAGETLRPAGESLRPAGETLRLILEKVNIVDGQGEPGLVLEAGAGRLVIATGENALLLEAVQPAGKRVLAAAEFLRGYPVRAGERFG